MTRVWQYVHRLIASIHLPGELLGGTEQARISLELLGIDEDARYLGHGLFEGFLRKRELHPCRFLNIDVEPAVQEHCGAKALRFHRDGSCCRGCAVRKASTDNPIGIDGIADVVKERTVFWLRVITIVVVGVDTLGFGFRQDEVDGADQLLRSLVHLVATKRRIVVAERRTVLVVHLGSICGTHVARAAIHMVDRCDHEALLGPCRTKAEILLSRPCQPMRKDDGRQLVG
mmetsp:Transcript_5351/g.15721  ORF Transcript_5351/g.15721 Transcript_5351/m.15721 type:complete len:230 (-) Transcript_5351:563-1252(-)